MNSKRGVTSSGTKNRVNSASSSKESLTPVIPHIKIVDNVKTLPKFTAALARNPDDILPAEELDAIQLELEHLLSTVALRYRVLKSEVDTIDKAEENRDKRGRVPNPKESSPNKKKKFDERNRFREGSGKLFSTSQRQKLKNTVSSSPVPSSSHEDSMDAPPSLQNPRSNQDSGSKFLLPKNDIPNKFWLSVEPYCMPITQEDIKLLDDLIEEYTGTGLPSIPELGPHYSMRWAMEDFKDAQEVTGTTPIKKENGHTTPPKKGEGKQLGDGVLGPLTQRLVSALIEDTAGAEHASNGSEGLVNGRDMQPIMKNGINIEKRLRKELVEHGILEAEDLKEEDDEILTEIKRVRAELTAIGEYNANELRKLHTAAVDEMRRLDVKKQLETKDQEIIEYYRKLQLNRQKHRPLTKAEKEEVIRLCEEQRRLSDHLETFTPPGPHFSID